MAKKAKLNQRFNGKLYHGYDTECVNDDGYLECPKCGNCSTDFQMPEVEILQHSFMKGKTRATLLVACAVCGYDYGFQSMIEPSENIVIVER
jgi:predicted nucleic-acid-binding Zn-ribbon protein